MRSRIRSFASSFSARTERTIRRGLRSVAALIALLGAIDPSVTSVRRSKPIVAVVHADQFESNDNDTLALRVSNALSADARIVRGAFSGADATVIVGDDVPASPDNLSRPTYAVLAHDSTDHPVIESLHAPSEARARSRVTVEARLHIPDSDRRTFSVELRDGPIVVDRVSLDPRAGIRTTIASLGFAPTTIGTHRLRVDVASTEGSTFAAHSDAILVVRDSALQVLVYDPRPSWMSTFVRRALERDPRLAISSRVMTARNIATAAGTAPSRLDDAAAIARFDAIVVGAPTSLSDNDVSALERYMRQRGGSVVFLLDANADGPHQRLMHAGQSNYTSIGKPTRIAPFRTPPAGDVATPPTAWLLASELWSPTTLASSATVIATASAQSFGAGRDDTQPRAILWKQPVGSGELTVSGALDAWRFRDQDASAFDLAWQEVVASAASASINPVSVQLSHDIVSPGEPVAITVAVRSAMFPAAISRRSGLDRASANGNIPNGAITDVAHTKVQSWLESGAPRAIVRTPIDLWPDGLPGMLRGSINAPDTIGEAHVVVIADGIRREVPLVVDSVRGRVRTPREPLQSAWVTSLGGKQFGPSQIPLLAADLQRTVGRVARRELWYPMRSVWWLFPFVLALSAEWYLRRRRGLP